MRILPHTLQIFAQNFFALHEIVRISIGQTNGNAVA